jgi:putative salt-induced outer membrane protein YdiY
MQAVVTLTNGDILRGTLVSDGDPVIVDHPVMGRLSFKRSDVASVRTMTETDAAKSTAAAVDASSKIPPPPPGPDPDSFFKGWKGSVGLGLNGATGNSEALSVRGSIGLVRETSQTKTTTGFVYNYATSDGEKSTDNARFDIRNDWLPQGESHWRPFVQGAVEYDQFQDWDYRFSAAAGMGYELIKTDKMLLLPRAGIGFSKEIGGSDNKIHPEGLLGVDFEYKIDDRSKFFASGDSYWLLDEIPEYRLWLRAGYEILVDSSSGLALKVGVEDRYQSSPGAGRNRSDFTYFAQLVFNF